jgi:hypothetical protein
MRSLCFLLRKMLPEVTPGLQQLNPESHPRDKQARRAVNVIRLSCARLYQFVIAVWRAKGSAEKCNCDLKKQAHADNHIVLVDPAVKTPTVLCATSVMNKDAHEPSE